MDLERAVCSVVCSERPVMVMESHTHFFSGTYMQMAERQVACGKGGAGDRKSKGKGKGKGKPEKEKRVKQNKKGACITGGAVGMNTSARSGFVRASCAHKK